MKQGIGAPDTRFARRNAESVKPTSASAMIAQRIQLGVRDCIINESFKLLRGARTVGLFAVYKESRSLIYLRKFPTLQITLNLCFDCVAFYISFVLLNIETKLLRVALKSYLGAHAL